MVRALLRVLELLAFLALVWLAVSALRLISGEPWPSIMHRRSESSLSYCLTRVGRKSRVTPVISSPTTSP
jgi:hypothetical protein